MASIPGRYSTNSSGSRTGANAAAGFAYQDIIVVSEWYFKSAGRLDLIGRFKKSLAENRINNTDMVVKCDWDDTQYCFELKCCHEYAHVTQYLFVKAMLELIAEEEGKNGIKGITSKRKSRGSNGSDSDLDSDSDSAYLGPIINQSSPLASNKIQRLAIILAQRNLPSNPTTSYPPQIALCKEQETWTCANALEHLLCLRTVNQLVELTGCLFVIDLDAKAVYLGAREEEQIRQAVCRLDNIKKYSDKLPPLVCHVFYTESTDDFELSLKYLQDVRINGRKFFDTTLLDPKSAWFHLGASEDDMHTGVTVRCATLGTQGSYKPISKSTATGIEPVIDFVREPWTRFSYNPRGINDPARHFVDKPVHVEAPKLSSSASEASSKNQGPSILPNDDKPPIPVGQKIEKWQATVEATKIPGGTPSSELVLRPNQNMNENARGSWDRCEGSLTPRFENTVRANDHLGIPRHANMPPHQVQSIQYMQVAANNSQKNNAKQSSDNSPMTLAQRVAVNGAPVRPNDFPSLPGPRVPQSQRNVTARSSSSSIDTTVTIPSSTATGHSSTSNRGSFSVTPNDSSQAPAKVTAGIIFIKPNGKVTKASKVAKPASTATEQADPKQNSHNPKQTGTTQNRVLQPIPQSVGRVENARPAPAPNGGTARPTMSIMDQDNDVLEGFACLQLPAECLQKTSEGDSRTFYNTMNQKAGKKRQNGNLKKNPFAGRLEAPNWPVPVRTQSGTALTVKKGPDPIPEFSQKINKYFEELLTGLKGFQGKIHIRVEFGRILLNDVKPMHIADKDIPGGTLSENTLRQILEGGPNKYKDAIRPITLFTNVLTTTPKEIDGLLSTNSAGSLLWERNYDSWGVVYEFMFRDPKSGGLFSIEIDGERFKAKIIVLREFGDIFVHGTKRHWDCRISATGDDGNTNPDHKERYGALVDMLLATLYIPASTQAVAKFELNPAISEQFPSIGARVHRHTAHLSKDGRSILKLTEVIPLPAIRGQIDDHVVFVCEQAKPGEDSKYLKNWFVVSIESTAANKLLEQNENLELGEEAGWTPEMMASAGVTKELYLPACAMLTSICGVGIHNNNGLVARAVPRPVVHPEMPVTQSTGWW